MGEYKKPSVSVTVHPPCPCPDEEKVVSFILGPEWQERIFVSAIKNVG